MNYRLKILTKNINNNKHSFEDFDIAKLDNLLDFNKDEKLTILSLYNESYSKAELYKTVQGYCLETVDMNYDYWYCIFDRDSLKTLFNTNKLAYIIFFPADNNFIKREGYKVTSSGSGIEIYVKEYAKTVIDLIEEIDSNETIYVYSFKTNIRLSIYKESNLYIAETLEDDLELEKQELINILNSGLVNKLFI